MTWLLAYRRQIAMVAAVLALLGALAWWGHSRYQAGVRDEQARAEAVRTKEKSRTDIITRESGHAWNVNLDSLNTRVTRLLAVPEPVRLCSSAPAVRVPAAPGRPDAEPADNRPVVQAGPNLRGQFILYGGDCERTRQQLESLQRWILAVE